MPVGVDIKKFQAEQVHKKPSSILSLGRVAPSKKIDVLVAALALLQKRGVACSADIYGPTLPEDSDYREGIEKSIAAQGMSGEVVLYEGVAHAATPALYASHEIFVNLAASGMYDKTLFEAAASGALVVALSDDFAALSDPRFTPRDASAEAVAETLERVLALPETEKEKARAMFRAIAEKNSLSTLAARLAEEITL